MPIGRMRHKHIMLNTQVLLFHSFRCFLAIKNPSKRCMHSGIYQLCTRAGVGSKQEHLGPQQLCKCEEEEGKEDYGLFILQTQEGSHREVYRGFPTQLDIFRRWCKGLFRPQVPYAHCPITYSEPTTTIGTQTTHEQSPIQVLTELNVA